MRKHVRHGATLLDTQEREWQRPDPSLKVQSEDQIAKNKKKEKPADPKELKLRYVEIT